MDPAFALKLAREAIVRTGGTNYCPQVPTTKQAEFLGLTCREGGIGGSAGGGKSSGILMAALQYFDRPNYSALLLRRSYADLALSGALMDRAAEWLSPTAATYNGIDKKWVSPKGATLQFGYMGAEKDKYRYQSAEFQFIGVDELTQWPETQYRYLMSRLRKNVDSDIPLRMRFTTNPGGIGHDWVKERFIDNPEDRIFIPSTLDDNPYIDADDYRLSLAALDETTRKQLLEGIWIKDSQGLVYKFSASRNLRRDPSLLDTENMTCVLGVDLGTSESTPTTAFTLGGFYENDDKAYVLSSVKSAGDTPASIAESIQWYRRNYSIERIVIDAGGLGGAYIKEFRQRYAIPCEAAEKSNKLGFRKLMNGEFESGRIIAEEGPCSDLIDEWQNLIWNALGTDNAKGQDNHCTDSALYMWRAMRQWQSTTASEGPILVPGSREWSNRAADKMKSARSKMVKNQREVPFWAKRGA